MGGKDVYQLYVSECLNVGADDRWTNREGDRFVVVGNVAQPVVVLLRDIERCTTNRHKCSRGSVDIVAKSERCGIPVVGDRVGDVEGVVAVVDELVRAPARVRKVAGVVGVRDIPLADASLRVAVTRCAVEHNVAGAVPGERVLFPGV